MQRRKYKSRSRQRQDMLREMVAQEGLEAPGAFGRTRAIHALAALQRIREGTYGVCVDCGSKIPTARLQVMPDAARCVGCQTEFEGRSFEYLARRDHVA